MTICNPLVGNSYGGKISDEMILYTPSWVLFATDENVKL